MLSNRSSDAQKKLARHPAISKNTLHKKNRATPVARPLPCHLFPSHMALIPAAFAARSLTCYWGITGEEGAKSILAGYSCLLNADIEDFLHSDRAHHA